VSVPTPELLDRIVHISDLHFWHVVTNPLRLLSKRFVGNLNVWLYRRHEFIMSRAEEFAENVVATGIQVALMTGDFTSTANRQEYRMARAFVEGLKHKGLRIELVPGNHDVYTFHVVRVKRFERTFGEFIPEEGYPALRVLPGGTPLILVPTVRPNLFSSRGRITDAEVAKVSSLLEQCPEQAIVAGHYPILDKTYAYNQHASHRLENAEALHRALGTSGRRILYVCGHTHRFSYVQDAQYPYLSHLSTGAFFRSDPKAGLQGEFAEIHATRAGFAVYRHTHEKEWSRRAIDIQPLVRD
jgi:UDP-2,3-diacylglucosamine pyrophosphatase LpxH